MNPDASHPREEEAIAYAFGIMSDSEKQRFDEALKTDNELRLLVAEIQQTAAAMTYSAHQQNAPSEIRSSVLQSIKTISQPHAMTTLHTPAKLKSFGIVGWAAAAALAVIGAFGWNAANHASQELAVARAKVVKLEAAAKNSWAMEQSLKLELAKLTKSHETAKMQIATLQATVSEYQQGVAVVVWNGETQEGILKLEKMPPVALDKDYQLWVVDPSRKTPVNAGIVKVDANGFAKIEFKPTVDVQKADKFALSVEEKGGVSENVGPIILLSQ